MAKNRITLGDPHSIADKIVKINGEILAYEEPLKQLKAKREDLRTAMLESLKANRMGAFSTEDGVMFTRATRTGYEIADEKKALKWAQEHDCLKVDTAKLARLLKGSGAMPDGIEYTATEYLATKGVRDALQDNE